MERNDHSQDINEELDIGSTASAFADRPVEVDRKTNGAFSKAAEKLHKDHSALNRTFTLPFLLVLLCVMAAAFAIRQFIAEPTVVDGPSMQTTLMDGERVLVEKVSYWFREPQRGDIVIVRYPNRTERFVKRVIALPGEKITISKGCVLINDEQIDESAYWIGNIYKLINTVGSENGSYTVPEGYYFVIGDNRNKSHDSRDEDVGPIAAENVLGRVRAVVWPLNKIRSVSK
ncbi:MAG: signal peptidase I [Clostridia bacterium]|nr:signal peptidase I [Clostridia bacterium]